MNEVEISLARDIGAATLEDLCRPISAFYVDLECLYDLRLTSALLLATDKDMDIIRKNLDAYSDRDSFELVSYFEGVSFTEEDIDANLKAICTPGSDKSVREVFIYTLQKTAYFDVWLASVRNNKHTNQLNSHSGDITIKIGCSDLSIPMRIIHTLIQTCKFTLEDASITATKNSIDTYTMESLTGLDVVSVYNCEKMLNAQNVQKYIESGGITEYALFAPAFVTNDVPGYTREQLLHNLFAQLSIFISFNYINIGIPNAKKEE